jgi:tryptophanyl-tRNA synthetase
MRILSGIQSSGQLHLGNYYGAIRQWVQLQEEGEALYFIANLHALTTVRDPVRAAALTQDAALALFSLGLDPARATVFRQSDIAEIPELYWILGTVVPLSNLEKAVSYKDKVAQGISPDFGLFAYPLLQAADILIFGSDLVPVGKDQVQHIELARDWATKFNVTYVPGYDPQDPEGKKSKKPGILRLPAARIQQEAAVVPGVDGLKMSKSYGNTIDLFGDEKDVKKRIMGIKTDATPVEAPKPTDNAPLYELLKLLAPPGEFDRVDQAWRAGGTGYGDFKKRLLDYFHATFGPARARRAELLKDPAELERLLLQGAERARAIAAPVVDGVRRAVGLR